MAIYNGKHCVFEEVGCESSSYSWNGSSNLDDDNCYNDWNISYMRTGEMPSKLLLLSSALQDNLTATTIQTAKNGKSSTLVSTSDKLFILAEKEMSSTNTYSVSQEFSALTTLDYWVNHTTNNDRKKYDSNATAKRYWTRSPSSGATDRCCYVGNDGAFSGYDIAGADASQRFNYIAVCFAF